MPKKTVGKKSKPAAAAVRDNSPDKTRGAKKMAPSAANPTRDNSPQKTRAASTAAKKAPKKSVRGE